MNRFLRRNIYWILLTGVLAGIAVYLAQRPLRPRGTPTAPFAEQEKLLKRMVDVHLENMKLSDAIQTLAREADCTILVDRDVGPEQVQDSSVTVRSPAAVTLEQALDIVLRSVPGSPGGVAVWERSGMVMVAPSRAMAEEPGVTVVYDISSLVWDDDAKVQEANCEKVAGMLGRVFNLDGFGQGEHSIWRFDRKLIVRTSPFTQREIANMLENWRE